MKYAVTLFLVLGTLLNSTSLRADYSEIRQLPGSPGQQYQLNAGKISGTFTFQTSDPFGAGDDGGLVIRSPNGYWVRAFSHATSDPIQLDWFQLKNGDVVSELLISLAQKYSPRLFVQMPSAPMELIHNSGTVDWTSNYGIVEFRLLESDVETSIRVVNDDIQKVWLFGSMNDLVIGSVSKKPNRRNYKFTLVGPWRPDNRGPTDANSFVASNSMIEVRHDADNNAAFTFRLDTKFPLSCTIRVSGNGNRRVIFAGEHRYGGCLSTTGVYTGNVHFEDAYVSDELGVAAGWDGSSSGQVKRALGHWRGNRSTQVANGHLSAEDLQVTGELTAQYGGAGINLFFVDKLGEGADKPLVFNIKDYGWTGPNELRWPVGVALADPVANDHPIKSDGLGQDVFGWRFVHVTESNQWGKSPRWHKSIWFAENAQCDDVVNCGSTQTTETVWTYSEITGSHYYQNGNHPSDAIERNVIQGDGVKPAAIDGRIELVSSDIARYGKFHDILIDSSQADKGPPYYQPGNGNRLTNVTLSGRLTIEPGASANLATNLNFTGPARSVLLIDQFASISISNLCAPSGSTANGTGSLTVNGAPVSLPYFIRGSDCVTPLVEIPLNPLFPPELSAPGSEEDVPTPPIVFAGR